MPLFYSKNCIIVFPDKLKFKKVILKLAVCQTFILYRIHFLINRLKEGN